MTNADIYNILKTYKTTTTHNERNNMTPNQAQRTLDALNVKIADKIIEHKDELGKHNKDIVEGELNYLWKVKAGLQRIINKSA